MHSITYSIFDGLSVILLYLPPFVSLIYYTRNFNINTITTMRTSTIAAALAAATPATVFAQDPTALGARLGFALGTKLADGTCKYTADYEKDFDAISSQSGSTIVRGYSASDCNFAQQILPAAQNRGFQVILGIWYEHAYTC